MNQIFVLGSSSAYGVGGINGGRADLLKQKLHGLMYGEDGVGEKYELYNFGKSGATADFVISLLDTVIKDYQRDNSKSLAIINVGGNNAKAKFTPENYVSTPEAYEGELRHLLMSLQARMDGVIFVSSGFYDESKTNPKLSPFDGTPSYFTNERRGLFRDVIAKVTSDLGIDFLEPEVEQSQWVSFYTYEDGLHTNSEGYELYATRLYDIVLSFFT